MRHPLFRLILALPLLLVGCGHGPSNGVSPEKEFAVNTPLRPSIVPLSKVHAEPTPAVGVVVNGRTYAQGAVPSVAPTATPAAPTGAAGNLEIDVKLGGKVTFTNDLRVIVHQPGQTQVLFSQDFSGADLQLTQVSATATGLAPGKYQVLLQYFNQADTLYKQDVTDASVSADQTASTTF